MGRFVSEAGNFQMPPLGNHLGICYRIVDLGTQFSEMYQKASEKVMLQWELPEEKMDDGRPFVCSKILNNSFNEKSTLRHWLAAWRTRDFTDAELKRFDLQSVLGKPCMVNITEKDGKRQVGAIAAVPKGMQIPALVNEPFAFWIEEWDDEKFNKLSDGIKNMIRKSAEYVDREKKNGRGGEDDPPWDDGQQVRLPDHGDFDSPF